MTTTHSANGCTHLGHHEVGECPACGTRNWPDFAVVSRYFWSRTELGMGLEERTWLLQALSTRLPQVGAESVFCERCTFERCTLELDFTELWDDVDTTESDEYTLPPSPLVSQAPFWLDRAVECPDCGQRRWKGFSLVFQYLLELNKLEGLGLSTGTLQKIAISFAPVDVEYELCEHCTSIALQRPGTIAFFSASRGQPVFEPAEVNDAVENMFDSNILPEAA